MKTNLTLGFCLAAIFASSAYAQCAGCTTIVGPVYNPDNSPYNGTLFVTQSASFTSADGNQNLIGPPVTWTVVGGALSEKLEPNDSATPPGTFYTIKSAVTGLVSLVCRVETSASSVKLLSICTSTITSALTSSMAGSLSSASATLTFGSVLDGTCSDLTFSFPGLPLQAQLSPEWPSSLPAGLTGIAFASAPSTADIRLCNFSGIDLVLGGMGFAATRSSYTLATVASLTFPALFDGTCGQQSFSLSGVLAGDNLVPIWPTSLQAGVIGTMFVSAAGTITVNVCNWSGSTITPTGTYGVAVAR